MSENESISINLLRMTWNCYSLEEDIAHSVGLSVHEIHCLTELFVEKPCCVRKLVELLDLPSTSVSKLLRSLDRGGYISRSLDEADRRLERVALTDEGFRMMERILSMVNEYADTILKDLPPEKGTLLKGCIRLLSSKKDLKTNNAASCKSVMKTTS